MTAVLYKTPKLAEWIERGQMLQGATQPSDLVGAPDVPDHGRQRGDDRPDIDRRQRVDSALEPLIVLAPPSPWPSPS